MPKLTEEGRLARRTQIAGAALRCFQRKGFAGTSMADIIAEAGLSAGSIYSHFESKAELLRFTASSVLEDRGDMLHAAAVSAGGVLTPHDILIRLVNSVLPPEMSGILVQIFGEVSVDPELRAAVAETLDDVKVMIGELLGPWSASVVEAPGYAGPSAQEVTRRTADVLMVNVHGFLVRRTVIPDLDREALLADLLPDVPVPGTTINQG